MGICQQLHPNVAVTEFQFHEDGTLPSKDWIFVFGSNKAGRHGKGAALVAIQQFNAVYGEGEGLMIGVADGVGCYAIPTKDRRLEVLPLDKIEQAVKNFLAMAKRMKNAKFFITRVGCGLSGYSDSQIAPMFKSAPPSCSFAQEWKPYLV